MKDTGTSKDKQLSQIKLALTIQRCNFEELQASHKKLIDAYVTLKAQKEKAC